MNKNILVEGEYGHGGLGHFLKNTDWNYANLAPKGTIPFDWQKGYDVEAELGYKIPVKNQGTSGSCGGQAVSYYAEVLSTITKKIVENKSAEFIYRQVFQPGGGSFGGDLMSVMKNKGASSEMLCPSYLNNLPMTEEQMETVTITPQAFQEALNFKSSNYSFILDFDIDVLAQAVRDNHGIIIAIQGSNNGTWRTQFPMPPVMAQWGHWLYVGKATLINGKKFIWVLNSWGDQVGVGGWQCISEDYVNSGFVYLGMVMAFGTPSYSFKNDLYYGITSADVYFLQKVLNRTPETIIAPSGVGSPGNETYFFGNLTKNAVIKFQKIHGISPAIGYVGPITRNILNQL